MTCPKTFGVDINCGFPSALNIVSLLAIIFNIIATKLKEVDLSLAFTPALPFFPILSIQKVREILQKLIDDNKGLNIQLLVALIFLVAAVGKDSKGIILVKGEPSFSAGDTVLINELAFYIQSNDLKAY